MSDRLSDAWVRAVQAVASPRRFGVFEFEVISGDTEACDLQPTDRTIGLPDLVHVPSWRSPQGESVTYAPGSHVLLAFVNGDVSRPVVVSSDGSAPALEVAMRASTTLKITAPSVIIEASGDCTVNAPSVSLGTGAALGVARLGDTVQAGPFSGVITSASLVVKSA